MDKVRCKKEHKSSLNGILFVEGNYCKIIDMDDEGGTHIEVQSEIKGITVSFSKCVFANYFDERKLDISLALSL